MEACFVSTRYWANTETNGWTEDRDSIISLRKEARKIDLLEKQTKWFSRPAVENLFKRFTLHFGRPYISDELEYRKRLEVFIVCCPQ